MVLGSTLTTDDTLNFLGVDCCRAVNNPRMAMEGSSVIKKQIYIYIVITKKPSIAKPIKLFTGA